MGNQQDQFQQAVDQALQALNAEEDYWNGANAKLQTQMATPRPTDAAGAATYDQQLSVLSRQLEDSGGRVARAHTEYANVLARVASSSAINARATKDPN